MAASNHKKYDEDFKKSLAPSAKMEDMIFPFKLLKPLLPYACILNRF